MSLMVWDRSIADYPRLACETSDETRIMRAVQDCERGVLYFPAGVYEIAEMLLIENCCSLILHKSAVLKAVADMPFAMHSLRKLLAVR